MEIRRKKHHVECSCLSDEHQMKFAYYVTRDECLDEYLYVSFHLYDHNRWWKRLWHGIKYIFGYKSRYGDWDEILIEADEIESLVEYLQNALKTVNKNTDDRMKGVGKPCGD